jgi:hypothetical protein
VTEDEFQLIFTCVELNYVPVFAVNFGHDYSLCFRGIRLAVVGSARDGNKHIGIPLQFFTICLVHTSNVYFKILDICNDFVHSIT